MPGYNLMWLLYLLCPSPYPSDLPFSLGVLQAHFLETKLRPRCRKRLTVNQELPKPDKTNCAAKMCPEPALNDATPAK